MYLRFVRTPDDDEHDELQRMTQQEVGRVAERARMVLLSMNEFSIPEICRIFDLTDDTVYKWFDRFDEQGPEGLYDEERSGRPRKIDEDHEQEIERLLEQSAQEHGYDFTTWTVPRLKSHLKERMGIDVSDDTVRRTLARLDFVWRRPRWWIDYEDPCYGERMQAIEAALEEAEASDVTVLFEDETDVRRLPVLRQMWMRRGEQARVAVPDANEKFALYGVLDPHTGETFAAPYPKGKSVYTESFLERVMARFEGEVVLIWDQASWHTSRAVEEVIAGYDRLRVLPLPKRAPQENPVEDLWRQLKRLVASNLSRELEALKAACRRFFEGLSKVDALRMAGLAA